MRDPNCVAHVWPERLQRLRAALFRTLFLSSLCARLDALWPDKQYRADSSATHLLASHGTTLPQPAGAAGSDAHQNLLFRLIDIASVLAFAAFQVAGWLHLLQNSDASTRTLLFMTLSSFFVSWLFADFASGAVHYAADHFGDERTPIVGKFIIATFRQHHDSPEAMLRHGFFERNGNCALIALVAIFWVPWVDPTNHWLLFLALSALFVGLWTLGTNQFHAWAHAAERPGWVNQLQRARIILAPHHHHMHHAPFEKGTALDSPAPKCGNYCITHGNCELFLSALIRLTSTKNTPKCSP